VLLSEYSQMRSLVVSKERTGQKMGASGGSAEVPDQFHRKL
jgi:hypothetical protein